MQVETIRWEGDLSGHVRLLDQTLLPESTVYLAIRSVDEMHAAIQRLAIRGAPAIGVAAAFGVLLGVHALSNATRDRVLGAARDAGAKLVTARPTAVNLAWGVEKMIARAESLAREGVAGDAIVRALFDEAASIRDHDRHVCRTLGQVGAPLVQEGWTVLTHCNAGALATAGIGTALAPIYRAVELGRNVRVFADETRPLLQGARLTAWELKEAGIDVTLITDSMAGRVMYEGRIDAVFVGADRIALNGDTCNKIGTYSVAVLAREHGIPFYVVAPLSTFDPKVEDGGAIPIEERGPDEITHGFSKRTAPAGIDVYNPAFDVTPARFITAIVTEVGLIERPDRAAVEAALARGGVSVPKRANQA